MHNLEFLDKTKRPNRSLFFSKSRKALFFWTTNFYG
jgi:hypothetical protein